jgi:RNase P subunit RPR2
MAARLKQVAQARLSTLFGIHSTSTKTQAELQRTYTGLGALIEVGFEYIIREYNDGGKIFRKRK